MAENHIEDEDLKRYRIEKQVKAINEVNINQNAAIYSNNFFVCHFNREFLECIKAAKWSMEWRSNTTPASVSTSNESMEI